MHERTVRARTATGIVEGFTRDGVHRWRSIPYARAPVGSLRFRAPQPAQPWPGVRHCHTFANCAPQQRRYTVMGIGRYQTRSEDCLTLNVVTPEEPATQPLPVMVFIHGGGYILGSSATPIYDGAALARRGCVYVSVNYRLGALGCLDLSSLSTPQITLDSNVYLRDLVLALRWVHDNIAEFGGDPGNVTIFGESAGAHITATLLAVPAAKGLFARAISESPAAGMVRSREVAAEFAARFANLIGARTQDAANALMQASPAQLVEAQHHLIRQGMRKRLGAFPIGPVFGDDYLPMDPVEAMRSGRVHAVPLIVGTNAEEGRLFTRFLGMLPTNEPMVEELLSGMKPADRERITADFLGGDGGRLAVRLQHRQWPTQHHARLAGNRPHPMANRTPMGHGLALPGQRLAQCALRHGRPAGRDAGGSGDCVRGGQDRWCRRDSPVRVHHGTADPGGIVIRGCHIDHPRVPGV